MCGIDDRRLKKNEMVGTYSGGDVAPLASKWCPSHFVNRDMIKKCIRNYGISKILYRFHLRARTLSDDDLPFAQCFNQGLLLNL